MSYNVHAALKTDYDTYTFCVVIIIGLHNGEIDFSNYLFQPLDVYMKIVKGKKAKNRQKLCVKLKTSMKITG